MASGLVHLPDIERLSSRVIRILGGNPGKFTLQGTNTYLIGHGPTRLLIDTGQGHPEWLHSLQRVLASEQTTITHALLTHWHPDHTGGVPDLQRLFPSIQISKHTPSATQSPIGDGQVFRTAGATLTAHHCPGHTTDHMAFVLAEEDAMFTGDNVLGHGTAVFEDLAAYMLSLEGMKARFSGRAYPGHGPVVEDGVGRIAEYILHRGERERQVLEVLGREKGEEWGPGELVKVIYRDTPESLHAPAEKGVVQVLRKLEGEGRVAFREEAGTWVLGGKASL